ncbi:MAG: aspartate aminotransferase family protein [Gemmatimonadota bacterium]|nr:aspartate aminotransferase family protein [Gemmatimonadota bacterium]MDH5757939.1 aspartate aminotransferase family protein [Gemmatimonadota bacterium]
MSSVSTGASSAEILRGQEEYLLPAMLHLYGKPLALAEGEGVRVRDADGKEYLDLFSGILTTSIGHCHPRIAEAVTEQMGRLGHVSTLYATEAQVEAAKRLAAIAPGNLKRTFFTNSGTEAIETALQMACVHTGRSEIVALRLAYHGRSFMASTVTAHAAWRPIATRMAGVHHAISPYPYRCPFKQPCDDSCTEKFARDLEEVILTTTNGQPAAFIAETIQGVGGYVVPPPGYFQRVSEIIRKYGGLLIIDEVQAGFGRTGDRWFGIEHWGVEPDIMVMAKGIAGGFPVGATITTDAIARSWTGKTISTFGGNPISMAAMSATLDVMKEEDAPGNAGVRGRQLREGMEALQARYPWIGEVRGMGLMQAMEIVADPESKEPDAARTNALLEATRDEGLLLGQGGMKGHVVRVGPSLLVTEDEIAEGLEKLERACGRVER